MKWQFSNDAPIYSQLIAQIKVGIVSGAFPPGERLPSVRGLATEEKFRQYGILRYSFASIPTPCSGP